MSISGLCQVCESREANHSCENCGALVCEMHYDDDLHYCTDCAAGIDTGEENHPSRGEDDLPGDDPEDNVYR